jgi:hypothetical protein
LSSGIISGVGVPVTAGGGIILGGITSCPADTTLGVGVGVFKKADTGKLETICLAELLKFSDVGLRPNHRHPPSRNKSKTVTPSNFVQTGKTVSFLTQANILIAFSTPEIKS